MSDLDFCNDDNLTEEDFNGSGDFCTGCQEYGKDCICDTCEECNSQGDACWCYDESDTDCDNEKDEVVNKTCL